MRKLTTKKTNRVEPAKLNTVKLTSAPNKTTNGVIRESIFKRECAEYEAGILPFEHDLYIGERCG